MKDEEKIQELINNVEYETQPLLDYITNLQEENEMYKKEKDALMNSLFITRNKYNNDKARYRRKAKNYKARIDKAIEYTKTIDDWDIKDFRRNNILKILKGE